MELQTVRLDGRRQRLTIFELVCIVIRQHLVKGDLRTFREYEKLLDKLGLNQSSATGGFLVVSEPLPENDEAAEREWEASVEKSQRELKVKVRDWVDEMTEQARKKSLGDAG